MTARSALEEALEYLINEDHDKAVEALYEVTNGDCRKVENILQSSTAITDKIDENTIYSLASVAKPKEVSEFLNLALQNKFVDARAKLLDTMLSYGLSGLDIIKQIQSALTNLDIDNRKKLDLIAKCGEAEFRMTEGSDEYLQLEAYLANVALVGLKKE